jgi:para-nitrobenzyl esterase
MLRTIGGSITLALLFAAGCGSSSPGTGGAGGTGGGTGTGGSTSTGGAGGTGGDPSLVQTDKGAVQGTVAAHTRAFLGIPYAAAPVGPLRWKPPAAAAAWTDTRDATKKGAFCPQLAALGNTPMTGTSEDCLTVNVWTPVPAPATAPVLVWIHGGGFILGSGGEATYDGAALAEATGAVVVTMNYRLGPLGWLGHSALAAEDGAHPTSAMYGFEDQRAALAWVKANAAAFGGDPADVTLFGESAGGISTCAHLLSPGTAGLFQRAIIESGPCGLAAGTEQTAEAQGATFATALGCTDPAQVLACLRGKTADELLVALPAKEAVIGPGGASWLPVIDGANLPDQPDKLLAAGKFAKVPVIIGSNKDEATLFFVIGLMVNTDADYLALVEGIFPGQGAKILAQYPSATYGSAKAAATAAVGEGVFNCPTRRTARGLAAGGAPVYLYHFTNAPKTLFGDLGAFHSAEVPFIFTNPYLGISLDEDQQKLSKTMQTYWIGLAKTGDPNVNGVPTWPQYDATTDQNLMLDLTITTSTGLKKAACDFWDTLGP